jgi:argininosuccinate lyase
VLAGVVAGLKVNRDRCARAASDPALLATDLLDHLVRRGVPFREAHHAVGRVVALAEEKSLPLNKLRTVDVRSAHPAFGIGWAKVFDLDRAMRARSGVGMPGPDQVSAQIRRWKQALKG